jgi:FdhD protein
MTPPMTAPLRRGIARAPALVIAPDTGLSRVDDVVVEAPLEIRVAGDPLAVTMRTPGEDRFLALGFLYAEGIIHALDDIGTVAHCGHPGERGFGDTLEVTPAGGARLDLSRLDRTRRTGLTTSSCGICGRDGIDDLLARIGEIPIDPSTRISEELLGRAPELLSAAQQNFARTGGLHAAAAIDAAGTLVAFAEDIGRHNAVDKVVGKLLYDRHLPRGSGSAATPILLMVSGRSSFEIVQKAATAGFPCVASVSAASSLAIETAAATGVTLAAFTRAGRFTLYSHPERITIRPR